IRGLSFPFGSEPRNPTKELRTNWSRKESRRPMQEKLVSDSSMKPATLDTVTAAPPGNLFEIVGLEKKFEDGQVQALRGVTFRVVQGEFVAITGPSGCGKTTLLQMLGALDRPTAGTLLYHGKSIPDLPDPSIYRARKM